MKHEMKLSEHLMNEMERYVKLINESYVFDDETNSYNEEDMVDELPDDTNDSTNDDKINQIRALALDGIQEYAENVDSKEYDFFKKIWLMCDKVCSDRDNKNASIE